MGKKSSSNKSAVSSPRTRVGALVVILLLSIFGALYYFLSQEYPALFKLPASITLEKKPETKDLDSSVTTNPLTGESSAQKTPTPLIPDQGTAGTFAVSSGDKTDPQMTNVEIDPLDAKNGDNLKIKVTLTSAAEVKSFKGWVKSDTSVQEISFTRSSRSGITEVWTGSITLNSSVDYTYIITLEGSDGRNTRTLPLGIRKP